MQTEQTRTEPRAAVRPVFSTEDFGLLKDAVLHYLKTADDDARSVKFSNLYHRLGRLD